MSDEKTAPQHTDRSPGTDGNIDEPSLLVLALLEQLQSDRAHGRYYELSDYYAANPELEDEFLAMALGASWDNEVNGAVPGSPVQEEGTSVRGPLSPGVLRALARIPEFSSDTAGAQGKRVAESRAAYAAEEEKRPIRRASRSDIP
jgi:hypothetical protein